MHSKFSLVFEVTIELE